MPGGEVTIDTPSRHAGQPSPPAQHLARRSRSRGGAVTGRDEGRVLESTGDYAPVVAGAAATVPTGDREVVEEGRAQPLAEARDMLRARLDAAAQVLALVLGLLLA